MPATYVADSDGNGLAFVFDWKNQTYTAAGLERMSKLTDVVYKDEIMGYPVTEIDTDASDGKTILRTKNLHHQKQF